MSTHASQAFSTSTVPIWKIYHFCCLVHVANFTVNFCTSVDTVTVTTIYLRLMMGIVQQADHKHSDFTSASLPPYSNSVSNCNPNANLKPISN